LPGYLFYRVFRANCGIVGKSFSTRFSEGIIMTVIDQTTRTAQEVAAHIVKEAEAEAAKLAIGDRFDISDAGELSCSREMSMLVRLEALSPDCTVKHHHSTGDGCHRFEKIR